MHKSKQKFQSAEENNEYVDVDCDESISKYNKVKEIKWKIAKFDNDEKYTDNNNNEFELIISIKQVQK